MKLATLLLCAGLSLAGCVDSVITGGGQLAGMLPDKPERLDQQPDTFRVDIPAGELEKPYIREPNGLGLAVVEQWGRVQEITYWVDNAAVCRIVREDDQDVYNDCN